MKRTRKNGLGSIFLLLCLLASLSVVCLGGEITDCKYMIAPGGTGTLNKEAIIAKAASIAVPFVKNVGQFNVEVKYAADLFAGRFFLTSKELVYSLRQRGENKIVQPGKHGLNVKAKKESAPGKGLVFREYFVDQKGAKIDFISSGEQKAETVVSYFKGNDAGKWRSNVASYQSVSLGQVYPGVEVKLKASGKNVEKIFYVSPQSNVAEIKIGVVGLDRLKIAEDGRLIFKNGLGDLTMRAPIAWQEIAGRHRLVKVSYRLLGDHYYGFAELSEYDKKYPLIIDPDLDMLMASTFLGGDTFDEGFSLSLDSAGNVYLIGNTNSSNFPTTSGVYDQSFNGGIYDVFVSKLNSNLTTLLASTFLGGKDWDYGFSLDLDSAGNVYLTGYTDSADFPTTPGAYNQTYNGGDFDVFVSKLNDDLNTLLDSTYLGGSDEDYGSTLALDSSDNVYLTGWTKSADFPTTPGAYDRSHNGLNDAFVSKLNNTLTRLLASTFLGGSDNDEASPLALDSSGNVYVTGGTNSNDFPTTPGAYNRSYNGGYENSDVFILKLNNELTILLASTYLGGSDDDYGTSLALDSSGNVYLTGWTKSVDFPTMTGAYGQNHSGLDDAFVSKLNDNLTTLLASTFLGGSHYDIGTSLALDNAGNVYLTGMTKSADFPTTPGAYDQYYNDIRYYGDAFISKLNSSLTTLMASTFLGGNDRDYGSSLTLDNSGNVYLTGITGGKNPNFPFTFLAYDERCGYNDIFISKLNCGESVKLDLLVERREARAFSIQRQYGQIQFTIEASDIPVTQYLLLRRQGFYFAHFILLKTITPSELKNNQFQMQDKYLENDTQYTYTYMVEAYNVAGELVGRSAEKTI